MTSGQRNLTTDRIFAARGRFIGICQVPPVCPARNTCFLGPTHRYINDGWKHLLLVNG